MNEIPNSPGAKLDYRLDGEARALYHWQYRTRYNEIIARAQPGDILTPDIVPVISLISNSRLNWSTFDLRGVDRNPLENVVYPGKSAHIDFTQSEYGTVTKEELDIICDAIFGRNCKRQDNLYFTYLEALNQIGFTAFYTPLPNHPLHVRLVHQLQIENPDLRDVGKGIKEEMVKVWTKVKEI